VGCGRDRGVRAGVYGNQYASMAPLFEHYGIGLWMPEVGGRADWHAEDHEQTMLALGLSSKREITRTRIRVRTAMATQTREQGRYLGGRSPYGYRLADAGPHEEPGALVRRTLGLLRPAQSGRIESAPFDIYRVGAPGRSDQI
jgi:hypothetical protein